MYKVTESSIIPIYQGRAVSGELEHEQFVNARELWEKLKTGRDFPTWFRDRAGRYGFVEGVDFSPVSGKSTGGRPAIEYMLTIDMAKELSMVENNETGRTIRRYFIECERRYRSLEKVRLKAKAERRMLTDIIKELVPESPHKNWVYKHYTDLVYRVVTGHNAKELRVLYGLDDKANIRPHLSEDEIAKVVKFERVIQGLLSLGMDYEEIKNVIVSAASGKGAFLLPKKEAT